MPRHRLGPMARKTVKAKFLAVVQILGFGGHRADVVNSEEDLGLGVSPFDDVLWTCDLDSGYKRLNPRNSRAYCRA